MTAWTAKTERYAAWLWAAVCVAALFAATSRFADELELYTRALPRVRFCIKLADVLVIMLPYWFIPRRLRGLALVPLWGMGLLYIVDAVYFRFAGECLPISSLAQIRNADAPLAGSVMSLLRARDFLYFLPAALATALWCVRPVRRVVAGAPSFGLAPRVLMVAVALLCVARAQKQLSHDYSTIFFYHNGRKMSLRESTLERLFFRLPEYRCSHVSALQQSGVVAYMLTELYQAAGRFSRIELTDAQRSSIGQYAGREAYAASPSGEKNLVMIVVESLNAEAVDSATTPVLDSLIHAPGTLSCLRVRPQVEQGISSDGQLLYNTGLMPMRGEVAVQRSLYGNHIPTLAAQLSATHRTLALFADNGRTWNKRDIYHEYKFDTVLTSDDVARAFSIDSLGADDATLRFAAQLCDTLKEPFFLQLLTISTHYPFGEPAATAGGNAADIAARYRLCLAYFDRALGRFIESLRSSGLLERTMLVVVSDHHINMDSGMQPLQPIVFVAANCGAEERIDEEIMQADVFPTVLDLMGVAHGGWRGVGHSMLGPDRGASDTRQWSVSDTILRSDYFRP